VTAMAPARGIEREFGDDVREKRLALPRAVGKTRPQRVIFPMDLAGKEREPWWKVAPDLVRVCWRDGTIKVLLCRWPLE